MLLLTSRCDTFQLLKIQLSKGIVTSNVFLAFDTFPGGGIGLAKKMYRDVFQVNLALFISRAHCSIIPVNVMNCIVKFCWTDAPRAAVFPKGPAPV
jgi:hypothetical protein